MNTEHHTNPSHPENEKGTEELSKQRLEALMRDAEAVFSGIGEQIKSIGDTHLQRHDEMVARDEVRLRPLQQLRRTILASLESGELDRSAFDRIQELDDRARTGNGLVASQTEYLYTPDSTVNVVAGLVENRGQLEYKAQDYVNEDPSNQDNLSDGFFNGIKGINEATHTLDEMGEKLGRLYVHDNHLKESFYALRQKLTHLPLSYDEGMLNSLLRTVNEVIADAEDSDRSRDGVHKVAAELRKIADKLLDSSAQVSRSRE